MPRPGAGTTRSQLERWAAAHRDEYRARGTAFLGVFPDAEGRVWPTRDDIARALHSRVHRVAWVCNTEDHPGAAGRHWVQLGIRFRGALPTGAEFGDSYGAQTDEQMNRLLAAQGRDREHFVRGLKQLLAEFGNPRAPILTNPRPIQSLTSDVCGEYALAMSLYGPPQEYGDRPDMMTAFRFWFKLLKGGPVSSDHRVRHWAKIRH